MLEKKETQTAPASIQTALERLASAEGRRVLSRVYGKKDSPAALCRCQDILYRAAEAFPGLTAPLCLISSPGRTELGGNHTDHNQGRVLAAAVRLDALAATAPSGDMSVRLVSEGYEEVRIDLSELEPLKDEEGKTAALIRGTARYLKDYGYQVGGFVAFLSSLVPPGSGLSSSACVEVLFAAIFSHLFNAGCVDWPILAKAGQYAENAYFGKPCGLMDQMACAGGGVLAIDFKDPKTPRWRRLEVDFLKKGYALAIIQTGGSHEDLTEDYAAIPTEMKAIASAFGRESLRGISPAELLAGAKQLRDYHGDRALLRAMHFVAENDRVPKMVAALKKGKIDRYLKKVDDSGISSWLFLQNVLPRGDGREQGLALALALTAQFLGKEGACRVHGGGFSGTIQAYLRPKRLPAFRDFMDSVFGPGSVLEADLRPEGVLRLA